jgi:sugar/nucleoside kinase (ribokinase family)
MNNKKYCVYIGDVALDEYYRAEYWPTIKDKALVEALPAVPGGMIANAACVAAALGLQVKFGSTLNSGAITQALLADLESSHVDTSLVMFDETLPDSKTMIFLVNDEHTIFIPKLGQRVLELSEKQLNILASALFIYSTPSEMARLRCGTLDGNGVIDYCREKGARLVYDLDVDYIKDGSEEHYKRLDIAFFNEVGFRSYCGARNDATAAEQLLSYGLAYVVVTFAEKGCHVYSRDGHFHSPAYPVEVVDVTGAGDTFCSSFLFAIYEGKDAKYAADFANAAASICVSQLGARAGAVSADVVRCVMDQRNAP